jgi:hypothetical protein
VAVGKALHRSRARRGPLGRLGGCLRADLAAAGFLGRSDHQLLAVRAQSAPKNVTGQRTASDDRGRCQR